MKRRTTESRPQRESAGNQHTPSGEWFASSKGVARPAWTSCLTSKTSKKPRHPNTKIPLGIPVRQFRPQSGGASASWSSLTQLPGSKANKS